jgi:hypothetical protein
VKDRQKQWLTWGILTLVTLAISLFFGIQYPMPQQPDAPPEPIELAANFTNPVDIEGSSSASAPALTFESDTDTGLFRSAANTLNIATGGTERLEIDSSALTIVPPLELSGLLYPSFTDLSVSDGDTLTPTYTIYALDTSAAVTLTLAASATEGQLLVLIGDDANNVTIADSNVRTNDGSAQVIGQYDVIVWVYQDNEWIEISDTQNS